MAEGNLPRCPQCEYIGQPSAVSYGATHEAVISGVSFKDSSGQLHVHDTGWKSTFMSCSAGHNWIEMRPSQCPVYKCQGWGERRSVQVLP